MRRVLSLLLAFVMVLSLVPTAFAAENGETVLIESNGLTVTHGETKTWDGYLGSGVPTGGSIEWQASDNQIVAVATPGYVSRTGATLTFTNVLETPATLRFEYSFVHENDEEEAEEDRAQVLGLSGKSGKFEKELSSGEPYTITVVSPYDDYGPATLTITGLSLSTGGDVTATFTPAANGSYTVGETPITGDTTYEAPAGTKYAVSAEAASGYRFFGWYDGSKYISYKAEAEITVNETCTISPVFIKDTVAVFGVGEARFQSLNEADAYAKNGPVKTIVLMNDGILPAGDYTVSTGNTLLIPYDAANSIHKEATTIAVQKSENLWENKAWEKPEPYRTLSMMAGAKLTVQGSLNVGGKHSSGPFLTAGAPSGDLGMIQMAEGSNITVSDGGVLYCWGYIYGDGTVTVKDGGSVHENFQFSDFRGGNVTLGLAKDFLVFPLSQYYVQNIEVASTFEYGATEYVWGSIYIQSQVVGTSVKFIGTDKLCMFVPGKDGQVTKTYDPRTDRLILDIDGDGSINPMGLELGGETIDTQDFPLPINSNMTVNVKSGTTALNQSLALLPGAKLNIAKGAILSLKNAAPPMTEGGSYVHYTGGNNIIVYDRDQWLNAYQPVINNNVLIYLLPVEAQFVYTNAGLKRLQPVAYSPTCSCTRTEANLVDAVVDINGTLDTEGYIYTTVGIDMDALDNGQILMSGGGASVISSQGTGSLVMNNGAGQDLFTHQPIQTSTEVEYAYIPMISAQLQNKDGSYTETMGAAPGAVYEYCTGCGKWYLQSEGYKHSVEITWIVDGKDSTLEVCAGSKPVYNFGTDPVKDGFKFIGWSTGNDNEPEYTSENLPVATEDTTYFACFEKEAAQGGLLGDLNLNGEVNSDDLTLLARHVGGIEPMTDATALLNADVTGDGNVDSDDLTKHARYVGGIINSWDEE